MAELKPAVNKAASVIHELLYAKGQNQRQLAEDLEVACGSLNDYLRSRTVPSLRVAVLVDDYFKGRVPPRTWLEEP